MKDIQWTDFERKIDELCQKTAAPGKHCARNAMFHLKKAWLLVKQDPEMAVFRGITAEEESASAVFDALKRRKYELSDKLNPKDHIQKHALSQFINAVMSMFLQLNKQHQLNPRFVFDDSGKKPLLEIEYNYSKFTTDPNKNFITPEPPLHFSVSNIFGLYDFSREIDNLAKSKQYDSISKYIKKRANARNQILYASPAGIASISNVENFLQAQRDIVTNNLILYLLIEPHKIKQSFVEQSLKSFLKMTGKLNEEIDFK